MMDILLSMFEPENPQGQYYCSVGSENAFGREFLNEALSLAVQSGVRVTGSNIEVCPGQVEIQVCNYGIAAADDSSIMLKIFFLLGVKNMVILLNGEPTRKGRLEWKWMSR